MYPLGTDEVLPPVVRADVLVDFAEAVDPAVSVVCPDAIDVLFCELVDGSGRVFTEVVWLASFSASTATPLTAETPNTEAITILRKNSRRSNFGEGHLFLAGS